MTQKSENKKVTLRVDLNSDLGEKFLKLKDKWGLKTYTETIRYLIKTYYNSVEKANPSDDNKNEE